MLLGIFFGLIFFGGGQEKHRNIKTVQKTDGLYRAPNVGNPSYICIY